MKINLNKNGWTVEITELDIADVTPEQVNIIGCLVGTQTVVLIKNQQHLTIKDELRFIRMFGEPDINPPTVKNVVLENSDRILRRVTGKLDEKNNRMGLFGTPEELDWHANPVEDPQRKSVVYLRAVEGVEGSITSFINNVHVWQNLDAELKQTLIEQDLHIIHSHDHTNTLYKETMLDLYGIEKRESLWKDEELPKLIHRNKFNTEGLYFSFKQFKKFKELNDIASRRIAAKLRNSILANSNNFYDCKWEVGDVLLSDQWLGLHKRHAFKQIEQRLLHRAVVEYTHIDPNYKSIALNQMLS